MYMLIPTFSFKTKSSYKHATDFVKVAMAIFSMTNTALV